LLVLSQQSLCASFPQLRPNFLKGVDDTDVAQIFGAFVKTLQSEYQEEMIVNVPASAHFRLELTNDGPVFELDTEETAALRKPPVFKGGDMTKNVASDDIQLEADVEVVTKALERLPLLSKSKATLESCRIFRILSMKAFRAALSDTAQTEADSFAEALESAAMFFSEKQQEQIMAWTGLTIAFSASENAAADNLNQKLTDLKHQLEERQSVKTEFYEDTGGLVTRSARNRPDWKGRAAPPTPATAESARQWAASRTWSQPTNPQPPPRNRPVYPQARKASGGKGRGKLPGRSFGIASLDHSAALHGQASDQFYYGQLERMNDHALGVRVTAKQEVEDVDGEGLEAEEWPNMSAKRAAPATEQHQLKRPKGTPTVAPTTPGPVFNEEEEL